MESDNELEIENEGGQEAEASQAAPGPETSQGKGARKKAKEPAKKKEDPCIYCGKNCVKGCVQCAPSGAICPAQACQKKQLKGWKSRQKRWDRHTGHADPV